MTDQPTRTDLNRIVVGLDSLEARVDEAKAQSVTTARKARNMTATAIFVALLGVLVGARGWVVAQDAQDAIDTANEVRATARISSCDQSVDFATAHNDLVRRNQALLQQVAAGSTRPETAAFVAEQVAAFEANIVPVRDCSPEGIEAFSTGEGGYLPLGTDP